MKKLIAISIAGFSFSSYCISVCAEALPLSGRIQIHSILKGTTQTNFNDEYSHSTIVGKTFNDADKGPLHLGKVACSYSGLSHESFNKGIGFCVFEDKDGDKIYIQYAGTGDAKGEFSATNDIIGGTGKFNNIRGGGPSACTGTDNNSEFPCSSTFDYRLPK